MASTISRLEVFFNFNGHFNSIIMVTHNVKNRQREGFHKKKLNLFFFYIKWCQCFVVTSSNWQWSLLLYANFFLGQIFYFWFDFGEINLSKFMYSYFYTGKSSVNKTQPQIDTILIIRIEMCVYFQSKCIKVTLEMLNLSPIWLVKTRTCQQKVKLIDKQTHFDLTKKEISIEMATTYAMCCYSMKFINCFLHFMFAIKFKNKYVIILKGNLLNRRTQMQY